MMKAKLPMTYENYVFDLYGTLVDIRTWEDDKALWEKLSLFFGYYDAHYSPVELQKAYGTLVQGKEKALKSTLEQDAVIHMKHLRKLRLQKYFVNFIYKKE